MCLCLLSTLLFSSLFCNLPPPLAIFFFYILCFSSFPLKVTVSDPICLSFPLYPLYRSLGMCYIFVLCSFSSFCLGAFTHYFFFFDIINSENLSDPIFLLRQLIMISSPFAFLMYSFSTFSVYILFLIVLYLYIFCPQRDEAIFYLISKVYLFSKKF